MKNRLFTPVRLGDLELANRIVMAPMTRLRATDDDRPTPLMASYYAQRASAGLIVSEMTVVSATGRGYMNAPGIYTAAHAEGWRAVTDAVHREGGLIVAQIAHAGRISHSLLQPGGKLPVAPSAVKPQGRVYTPKGPQSYETPRALELTEIPQIVEQFQAGARLAREARFDGVELHAANGYLLDQFLRDGTNQRNDEYGGSAANRARLLVEVANAVSDIWGAGRVGVRISPFNPYNDIADSDPLSTFSTVAALLAPLGLAFLHVVDPVSEKNNPLTAKLHGLFGPAVIANGGYDKQSAEALLGRRDAEAVAFGAPFIANPDLVERFRYDLPLAKADAGTIYGGGDRGYADYPAYAAVAA